MKASDYLFDFGRPVAYYPALVKHLGSVNAVLFLCQIFYWKDKTQSELGIYKTVEEIEGETGLTYREQATARKQLVDRGVLVETHKRLEHKVYYRIDIDRLNAILESAGCGTRAPRNAESAVREETNPQVVNGTETTTETTTEKKDTRVSTGDEKFEEAWRIYPKREGGNSKADALKQWNARVRAGVDPDEMLEGVKRYLAYCIFKEQIGTQFVKQAATFFGKGGHYAEAWDTKPAAPKKQPAFSW